MPCESRDKLPVLYLWTRWQLQFIRYLCLQSIPSFGLPLGLRRSVGVCGAE